MLLPAALIKNSLFEVNNIIIVKLALFYWKAPHHVHNVIFLTAHNKNLPNTDQVFIILPINKYKNIQVLLHCTNGTIDKAL
jgi:hypothetical protein